MIRILGCALLWLTAFSYGPVQAKVAVSEDFTGTLMVILKDGEIKLIEAGEAIPDIPSDSTIQVIDGSVKILTEEGDTVTLACLDHTAVLGGGSSAELACDSAKGLLKVQDGSADVTDPQGATTNVTGGQEYPMKPLEKPLAAPTAELSGTAGEPAGGDLSDLPPVDSRSIDSSPST